MFTMFLNINRILAKIGPKNNNFSHWKTQVAKTRYAATPKFTKLSCFISCLVWTQKLCCWTRTQLKIRKTKIGKRDLKDKARQEIKKQNLDERNLSNLIVWACSFQARQAKKQGNKKQNNKEENKEGITKIRRWRKREREWKSGVKH